MTTEMIYPWALTTQGPIDEITTWLDPAKPVPVRGDLTPEQTDQCNVAKTTTKTYIAGYKTSYTDVQVNLSGNANPSHAPVDGMPDERVHISLAFSSPPVG